ncbi:MAG: hypothetical protein AB7I30_11030 [Isosphaeraceae bacterium]
MRDTATQRCQNPVRSSPRARWAAVVVALAMLGIVPQAHAGKLSWLDEVVQQVVRDVEVGGRAAVRGGDELSEAATRGARRLFAHEADESLELIAKRSDDLARAGRRVESVGESVLESRFARLLPDDPDAARAFSALAPAEKRLVVEMTETAQRLARRYPGQADTMIRALGTDGMTAVRVYGDDVAEVVVKEGTEALGVLRKTGRGGWSFFTGTVLPHKKKLIAAGVFAAFLADPDKFVDVAGRATEYAVREFAKAGVTLTGAVTGAAARGLDLAIGDWLAGYGLNVAAVRYLGIAVAGLMVVLSAMVLIGLPIRWFFRPILWPLRMLSFGRKARTAS